MSALATLQRDFLAHLQQPSGTVAGVADGYLPAATGLRIYSHAYRARLVEALDNDHPALGTYLGDALWSQLCDGYIAAHPSRVRSLRDFGAQLPTWLARTAPFEGDARISELCAFERQLLDSFDAADAAPLDFDALRARSPTDWPTLRPTLHPSLHLLPVRTNAVDVWAALIAKAAPPAHAQLPVPAWATWRDTERVGRFRSLASAEHAALVCVHAGGDIAALCETLAVTHAAEQVPAAAVALLQQWFAEGWITALR